MHLGYLSLVFGGCLFPSVALADLADDVIAQVAAFGNSYYNDAPFMRYVAIQPALPGGAKGTVVMINGMKLRQPMPPP